MDGGAWQTTIDGVAESDMTERLSHTYIHTHIHNCVPGAVQSSVPTTLASDEAGTLPHPHFSVTVYCVFAMGWIPCYAHSAHSVIASLRWL